MLELVDSEMMEAGNLLSMLGTKRVLVNNKEIIDFSKMTSIIGKETTHSPPLPLELSHSSTTTYVINSLPATNGNRSAPSPQSILQANTYVPQHSQQSTSWDPHQLRHNNVVEILMILPGEDAATECHKIIAHLFTQLLNVDDQATNH